MKSLKLMMFTLMTFLLAGVVYVNAQTIVDEADLTDGVYKLTEDSTEGLIFDGITATLDLNGHNITTGTDAILVKNDAKLTIKGTGEVSTTGSNAAITNLGATVIVESGTFNSNNWYTVKNLGTMTINGGTFMQPEGNTGNASLIANGWANGKGTSSNDKGFLPPAAETEEAAAILTINGGTFNHLVTTSTIKTDDWGKTTITDGKFTSANGFVLQATGECIVSGGTFEGHKALIVFTADGSKGYEPGIANISGGSFDAESIADGYNTKGVLTISGGTFEVNSFTSNDAYLTTTITGGSFTAEGVKDYIGSESKVSQENDVYVVSDNTEIIASIEEGNVEFASEEALNNSYSLYVNSTAKEETEKATKSITKSFADNKKVKDLNVINVYDIEVKDGLGQTVEMIDGKFVISLPVKEEMQKFDTYYVAYIKDGEVVEMLDAKLVDGKVVFNTTHLSTYAVVGLNNVQKNPATSDNFNLYVSIILTSLIGLVATALYTNKKRYN